MSGFVICGLAASSEAKVTPRRAAILPSVSPRRTMTVRYAVSCAWTGAAAAWWWAVWAGWWADAWTAGINPARASPVAALIPTLAFTGFRPPSDGYSEGPGGAATPAGPARLRAHLSDPCVYLACAQPHRGVTWVTPVRWVTGRRFIGRREPQPARSHGGTVSAGRRKCRGKSPRCASEHGAAHHSVPLRELFRHRELTGPLGGHPRCPAEGPLAEEPMCSASWRPLPGSCGMAASTVLQPRRPQARDACVAPEPNERPGRNARLGAPDIETCASCSPVRWRILAHRC